MNKIHTAGTHTAFIRKKNFILDKLLAVGVTHSQQGQYIRNLDYEELCQNTHFQIISNLKIAH
ncbi:hypothetical protein KHA93_19825 [Bacillus sp. FJAT-49732]|uniref:Uncharacterized protein n=1 Tax=Lederbergia citrisecunda TaxID=2833583 RepID=A0A942YLU9_9BACI|nr:hypothetical protein [Lederbergia citrisecunda]MBS4201858.1 hypothetical protein [Lederbergia citrisecunda]